MKFIQGTPRDQLCLYQDTLDSILSEDHVIRFIDLYIDSLNLEELGLETKPKKKDGRPPYKPHLFLKIYTYCWLNNVKRSSRAIERECKRNLELIWLTEQLAPAYWALANFRKQNEKVLEGVFYDFRSFCNRLDLLSYECVAIDGTKMRAQNSKSNIYKRETIDELREKVAAKIEEYLKELDENDQKEDDIPHFLNEDLTKKLNHLVKHKTKLEKIKEVFEKDPELQTFYANDPDSKFQSDKGKKDPGYNCQLAVDNKNKLISDIDVCTDQNDTNQLVNMKNKVKDTKKKLRIENKTVLVADNGYEHEKQILEVTADEEFDLYVAPSPDPQKSNDPKKRFKKINFIYNDELNTLTCPNGHKLKYGKIDNRNYRTFRCTNYQKCEDSHFCSKSKTGRQIAISLNHKEMEEFWEKSRTDIGRKIIAKRKEIVEHPFGTMKRHWGFTYFMRKGLDAVRSEFHFLSFIYNFKRVMNIIGIKKLIEILKEEKKGA